MRNMRAMVHLEAFLVTAVSTIIVIRLFLHLTGYPQIGDGSGLHVAHVLFGGMFMMTSILILLILMGRQARMTATFIGGIGFGMFIDEVGKFLTSDNNYFYQPSIAIMYVIFIAIFLVVRYVITTWPWSDEEYLMNALNEMEMIPAGGFSEEEKKRTVYFLHHSGHEGLAASLQEFVTAVDTAPPLKPGWYERARLLLRDWYRLIASRSWFPRLIMVFFPLQLLGDVSILLGVFISEGTLDRLDDMGVTDWAIVVAHLISAFFIFRGVLVFRKNRLAAFRFFERSVLVDIFIGQFFLFYKDQLSGLWGFGADIALLMGLRFIISQEQSGAMEEEKEDAV